MSDDLRERVPDTVPDDVELFERGGDVYGRDDHGEFKLDPMRGDPEPREDRCGWTLRYTYERYGQKRYCGGIPEQRFYHNKGSQFCKHHKSAEALMERHQELLEHGYFAKNYVSFVEKMSTANFIFAVEMFGGLMELSEYEFDVEEVEKTINVEDEDIFVEDNVSVDVPVPTDRTYSLQANELWTATLKEVMTQNMQEVVFEDGVQRETLAESADMEGQITDTHYEQTEHHLHLPISRLAKDIKEHLKNGGVVLDADDDSAVTFQQNDYTLDVTPEDSWDVEGEDASDAQAEFHEAVAGDAEEIEIEDTE